MALTGKIEKKDNKDVFSIEVTNGTIDQLEALANFLEKEEFTIPAERDKKLEKVIEVGISWLESLKERKEKEIGKKQ